MHSKPSAKILLAGACLALFVITLFLPVISVSYCTKDVVQSTMYASPLQIARGSIPTAGPEYRDIFKSAKLKIEGLLITDSVFYLYPQTAAPGMVLVLVSGGLAALALALAFAPRPKRKARVGFVVLGALVVYIVFVLSYLSIVTNDTNQRAFRVSLCPAFFAGIALLAVACSAMALTHRGIARQKYLFFMLVPFAIWLFVFAYLPMFGWILSLKPYTPGDNIFLSPWSNPLFRNFTDFLKNPDFFLVLRNTLVLNFAFILLLTPLAVSLAVLLSEIRFSRYKKIVQTASYLPHFISWVVVASLFRTFFSIDDGLINESLKRMGLIETSIPFLQEARIFPFLITFAQLWKSVGWESIIYLAAISSINPELYEAAAIDGASRIQRILQVTIPSIMPTIAIIVIMNSGWILSGFDPYFLIGGSTNRDWSLVIDVYVYQMGLTKLRYGYATAVGVFKTVVGLAMLLAVNFASKKLSHVQLFD